MLTLISIFLPIITGFVILLRKDIDGIKLKSLVIAVSATTVALNVINLILFMGSSITLIKFPFDLDFVFAVDAVSAVFSLVFSILSLLIVIYSFSYMEHAGNTRRFYAFFLGLIGSLLGVAFSANAVTFYFTFEMMTLFGYVLIIQDREKTTFKAARKYLYYSIFGASLGLISIFFLQSLGGDLSFTAGGISAVQNVENTRAVLILAFIAIVGFGCKAGMFPLHSWLATAHPVAPAPASAALSALMTKCGILAIIRIAYFVVGPEIISGSSLQTAVLVLALVTIFLGSLLALKEKVLKKRLAYSTVSNVSYVIFGLFLFNQFGFIGAMLQVIFHALAKSLLFLGAGTIIHTTGITRTDELTGIGYRMKSTIIMFTVASLSLVGIPLTGGFISKWYLAVGGASMDIIGVIGVLVIMISALLTAGYLFSVSISAFSNKNGKGESIAVSREMLIPMGCMMGLIIVLGIFPNQIIDFVANIATSLGL